MKTNDFTFQLTSKELKENIEKQFGSKINLEKYSREQLEDMRNKLRTRIFQQENATGINDLLTNETYQKDKAMVALLNTRIKEMLGEDIKKLRDRIDQINEAKKGTHPPKPAIKGKGSKPAAGDGDLANNYPPYDKVTRGDVIAGATGKDQKGGKAKTTKEGFGDLGTNRDDSVKGGSGMKPGSKYGGSRSKFDVNKDEPAGEPDSPSADKFASFKYGDDTFFPDPETSATAITSTDDDPYSKRQRGLRRVAKGQGTGTVVSPSERMERRMASQYLELMSDGEPVTDDEIQDVVDTMRASEKYRERVMKRVQMESKIMEAPKSEKQRKAAAIALSAERGGKKPKPGTASAEMSNMPEDELRKFAKKPKGKELPEKAPKKVKEANEIYNHHVQIVNESLVSLLRENEEEKAKAITAAGDIVNDYTSWMQRVGQYQTKSMIELFDSIRADFGPQEADTFKAAVVPALDATLDVLMQQREAISNAVAVLAGEAAPEGPAMGATPAVGPTANIGTEPGVPSAEPDQMNTADMTAAAEPAATGREVRESKVIQKIRESHSIMSKLSK